MKSLTSSPRRWAWIRAPSSFHSTEASPVSPMAAATSVAGDASIGCTGRNGVNSIAANAGAPPVERGARRDRQRAGHHRRPLHVTSGDVGRAGDGRGHHAVERALTQFAADDAEHESLLGLGGPLEHVAQDPATFAGRSLTRRRRQPFDHRRDVEHAERGIARRVWADVGDRRPPDAEPTERRVADEEGDGGLDLIRREPAQHVGEERDLVVALGRRRHLRRTIGQLDEQHVPILTAQRR